jgi:polyvinyl alcohol dehydrogenase (cytochrome)
LATLLSLVGCAPPEGGPEADATPSRSGQAELGESLYRTHCSGCHDNRTGGAPVRAALEKRSASYIKQALTTGVMKAQGAALNPYEIAILSDHLGTDAPPRAVSGKRCEGRLEVAGRPLWNRWGNGLANARYQRQTAITPDNVDRLELAWAFGFPEAQRARSQPAVTEQAIFTGSQSGRVYALDRKTGCIWWTFDAEAEVRNAPVIDVDAAQGPTLYFGDFGARVYALDARTGALRWSVSVRDHPDGTITGSLALHGGQLFVPMSSTEVLSAYNPDYACCTFRGGVTALDASDGSRAWRWYAVDKPVRHKNGETAPSGAPVWGTPTVDPARGLLYVGTGENYSSPANGHSDAIIALELATGRRRWVMQATPGDAWNAACGTAQSANCPAEDGPDFDFGAPPVLVKAGGGRDMLLAGQKSGEIFGLDPESGRVVWRRRAGRGGFNGGVHWGMASDGTTLFVPIADTPGSRFAKGDPQPGIHALDVLTGKPRWSRIEPLRCPAFSFACVTALSAPVTLIPGVVFAGGHDGRLVAYAAKDGAVLWMDETNRAFATVNGVEAKGGTIDGQGPVVAGDMVIVNSGYDKFGEIAGNVLLVYRLKGADR